MGGNMPGPRHSGWQAINRHGFADLSPPEAQHALLELPTNRAEYVGVLEDLGDYPARSPIGPRLPGAEEVASLRRTGGRWRAVVLLDDEAAVNQAACLFESVFVLDPLYDSGALLYAAAQGVSFVAIQEAMSAPYDVIENDGQPSVLYRALELVHQVIGGARLVSVSGEMAPALQVVATRLADGTIQVALVNHDAQRAQSISVSAPQGTTAQSLTMLAAPAPDATSHVSLQTRAWTGNAPVLLGPESMVVLTFRPS